MRRQVAWTTDESVLDLNEILKLDLKNDNVQSFNTQWDETIIAMKKQPDNEMLDILFYRQLQHEARDYIRLKKMVVRNLAQKVREKHVSSREYKLKSPLLALMQPKVSPRAKGKILEIAYSGRRRVNALEEKSVE